jgi:hypothetical protein
MKIEVEFGPWDPREKKQPWIAKVTAMPREGRPEMDFGKFQGTPSEGGCVEITAEPDDVVRYGQSYHEGDNSAGWYRVMPDGDLAKITYFSAKVLFNSKHS